MKTLKKMREEKPSDGSAAIAVIIRDEKILLGLREYEPEKGGASVWTAPGGSMDAGETLEEAVRRETKEETGIYDLSFVDYIGSAKAIGRDELYIFHCETSQDPELTEPDKFAEWVWYSLENFMAGNLENYINEPSRQVIVDYLTENDRM